MSFSRLTATSRTLFSPAFASLTRSRYNFISNPHQFSTMANPASTDPRNYKFNHTMIRVKDPKRSVAFYETLGMTLLKKLPQPEAHFDLYFLGYDGPQAYSRGRGLFDREGLLELTHNYGTENDPAYTPNNGNQEPHRGFGHTCISVDHLQAACKRLEDAGVPFQKKLSDGRMRNIAFALDPDGYWVELISQKSIEETENITTTDLNTYNFNHTMLRIKDPQKSLPFYEDILGLKLIRTKENQEAGFTLYFFGYDHPSEYTVAANENSSNREGILELTWNHGTEKEDSDFAGYHNGNDEPQGFGHLCVTVDNLDAACARFEQLGCRWRKRLTDGRMKNVAFLLDPDGYWVEIVQNERYAGKENF